MNLYFELLHLPVFTMQDLHHYYDNMESARSAIKRLMQKGMIAKIRNDLYTCIGGETGSPIANRYQIASAVTDTSYVSHYTAIEYYGLSDQVSYDVYTASETHFQDFTFDGYAYKYVPSKNETGVENVQYSGGVRVTDLEKTLVDSIKDMDKITGPEGVITFIQSLEKLDETKHSKYLADYNNQFLYQKTGYLLETYAIPSILPKCFFDLCKMKMGKSKRYLSKDMCRGKYDMTWQLIVPYSQKYLKNGVDGDCL
jgi:predicted transcriptional regulator of viral defense system